MVVIIHWGSQALREIARPAIALPNRCPAGCRDTVYRVRSIMNLGIENEIERVLESESTALGLSDRLFAVDGLFHQLALDRKERKNLVKSPLFRRAQQRFRELQRQEAADFSQSITKQQMQDFVIKAERAPSV